MEVKLTPIEHFKTLPPEVGRRAIRNTVRRNYKFSSVSAALYGAFVWSKTPEGSRYWKNKYFQYLEIENRSKVKRPYFSRVSVTNWVLIAVAVISIFITVIGYALQYIKFIR